jgi:hypothetical protein
MGTYISDWTTHVRELRTDVLSAQLAFIKKKCILLIQTIIKRAIIFCGPHA